MLVDVGCLQLGPLGSPPLLRVAQEVVEVSPWERTRHDSDRLGSVIFQLEWSFSCFVLSWSCFDMSVEHFARLLGFVDLRWLDWLRKLDVACILHFCLFKHVQAAFYSEDLTAKSDWTPASAVSRTWHLDTSKSLPFAQKIHRALAGIVGSNSSWKTPQEQVLKNVQKLKMRVNYSKTQELLGDYFWRAPVMRLSFTRPETLPLFNSIHHCSSDEYAQWGEAETPDMYLKQRCSNGSSETSVVGSSKTTWEKAKIIPN